MYRRPLGRPGSWLIPSLAPSVRPLAGARGSFAAVSIRGHCPPVGFASTYMQRVRLRRTALRATPRMHTSTQPPEGAGGSRSKAAGELTLGLMSGEERGGGPCFSVGAGSSGRRIAAKAADQPINHPQVYPLSCGSWLVGAPHRSEGGLTADQSPTDVRHLCTIKPARPSTLLPCRRHHDLANAHVLRLLVRKRDG